MKFWRMGVFCAVVAVAAVAAKIKLESVPEVTFWRTRLAFLLGLEAAYGIALVAISIGLPIFTTLLLQGRRRKQSRPWAARGMLLCISLGFAFLVCEATAAVVRRQTERPTPTESDRPVPKAGPIASVLEPGTVKLPTEFEDADDDQTVDILVVGESSAGGVPYNFWLSIGRVVAWQLEEAIPGRTFRPKIVAASGDTLEGQHKKLTRVTRKPELAIIYCGHNEFSARFSWSRETEHYLDAHTLTPWQGFVRRVERTSPLCALIRTSIDKCRVAIPPPRGGYRSLVDVPAYTPAERTALLADFQRRLELMVSWVESLGAVPILIIPPASDSGFEPNRSFLPPETPRAEREAFTREFLAVRRIEETQPEEALRRYQALAERGPGFAEVHFRIGRLLERSGDFAGACRHDILARDADGLPNRLQTPFADIYRAVAARHHCALIDGPAYFHRIAPHGLLNDNLFHDGLHPSLRGLIALSQAVVAEVRDRHLFGWPASLPAPVVDPAVCAKKFGIDRAVWVRLCHWGIMFYDLTAPARYDPSLRRAKQDAFGKAADKIDHGHIAPESVGLPNIGLPPPVPLVPSGPTGGTEGNISE